MSRPRNLTVVQNGSVFSVTPKNLKAFLKDPSNPLVGKHLGNISVDISDMTEEMGATLLNTLGLDDKPTDVPDEALAVVDSLTESTEVV